MIYLVEVLSEDERLGRLRAEARRRLGQTDFVVTKSIELMLNLHPDWKAWRGKLREIASGLDEPIPDEPTRYADAPIKPSEPHNFPENMSDKLSDWDTVPDEASLTTGDLTEDVIQRLTKAKRKKFTELLNVELAELQQERGGPREDLKRENEIEALLGLFARVGEM